MADQWRVLTDTRRHDKRWVEIEDTVRKLKYSGYFPLSAPDAAVMQRLKEQVQRHRAELVAKRTKLNLTNFEAGL